MAYNSLFDTIATQDPHFRDYHRQEYQGTLDQVVSQTEKILHSGDRETDVETLALHPPRIIRAYVDYKIQHPCAKDAELLLRNAIDLGLSIYRGENVALEKLKELKERTIKSGNEEVLHKRLYQPQDTISWNATNPARSRRSAENLIAKTNGANVLFVALAHGGVAAGMDTFLRYCDEVGAENSQLYVVRFSTQKLRDTRPQISPTEIQYLQEQAIGRIPIIFDEDRASGKTLKKAQQFFDGTVFPNKSIVVLTNLDALEEIAAAGFHKELLSLEKLKKPHVKIKKLFEEKIINNESFNSSRIIPMPEYLPKDVKIRQRPIISSYLKKIVGDTYNFKENKISPIFF